MDLSMTSTGAPRNTSAYFPLEAEGPCFGHLCATAGARGLSVERIRSSTYESVFSKSSLVVGSGAAYPKREQPHLSANAEHNTRLRSCEVQRERKRVLAQTLTKMNY